MAKNSRAISVNRKAYHDYSIQETLEAGLVLKGSEIKSIRQGKVSLSDAYARPQGGEMWLFNSHIASYDAASYNSPEARRPRKLLLHDREIAHLAAEVSERRLTLVPLRLYIKHGIAKVELGVARGKKMYDKREVIARRATDREIDRALKHER